MSKGETKTKRFNKTYKQDLTKREIKKQKVFYTVVVLMAMIILGGYLEWLLRADEAKANEITLENTNFIEVIEYREPTKEEIAEFFKNSDLSDSNKNVVESAISEVKTVSGPVKMSKTTIREVTMYNAGDPNQCDSTPCISANGENICEALKLGYKRCAANFVPFGTILEIEGYGECMVTDRMNSRYFNRVDIAMPLDKHTEAIKWGLKRLQVTIK